MKKPASKRGKISITRYLQKFEDGDVVQLVCEAAIQKGIYDLRYHGKPGKVAGLQGNCYKILIKDKGKEKSLLVHPVHLKRYE